MRIATFNVNGISARLPRLLRMARRDESRRRLPAGAEDARRDVPAKRRSRDAGYGAVWHGQKALERRRHPRAAAPSRSRSRRGLPGDPDDTHSRYIEAAVARRRRRVDLPAERQSAAGPEVRLQARLVRAPDRARAPSLLGSGAAGRPRRRLQRRADRRVRHLLAGARGSNDALLQPESRAAYRRLARAGLDRRDPRAPPGRARSTRSGTTSATAGRATPGCASTTCC